MGRTKEWTIESRGGRLLLRPLNKRDREEYVRVHEVSSEHFAPWMTTIPPAHNLNEVFEQELHRAKRGAAAGTDARLVGVLRDGSIAGFFTLSQIYRRAFQNAYAGWSVSADQTGRGLGTEGVATLLDLAFALPPKGLGLHRVQANVMPENRASLRVAQKAGFRLEGIAAGYLRIGGEWRDHMMFAKLADEHAVGEHAADDLRGIGT